MLSLVFVGLKKYKSNFGGNIWLNSSSMTIKDYNEYGKLHLIKKMFPVVANFKTTPFLRKKIILRSLENFIRSKICI